MGELPTTFVRGFHDEEAVRKMTYLALGNTGIAVSKLSLGGASFAPIYGHNDEAEAIRTIHASLRNGINYIDTAPYYGQGRSEEIIGKALKCVPRNSYYIATKVGRYETGASGFDFSAARTWQSISESLARLQLSHIDIIQIHDIEFAENVDTIINETLPVLEEARKQGKVRFIGVTAYPLSSLKEIITKVPGRFDCVLTYARYTMLDHSLLEHLSFFLERNIGVICAAATALGILTNRGEFDWHVASTETKQLGRLCAEQCKRNSVELGKLAVWYSTQLQGPATLLIGMPTTTILAHNLDVCLGGLAPNELDTLKYCLSKLVSSGIMSNSLTNTFDKYRTFHSLLPSQRNHWEGIEIKQLFNR